MAKRKSITLVVMNEVDCVFGHKEDVKFGSSEETTEDSAATSAKARRLAPINRSCDKSDSVSVAKDERASGAKGENVTTCKTILNQIFEIFMEISPAQPVVPALPAFASRAEIKEWSKAMITFREKMDEEWEDLRCSLGRSTAIT